MPWVEGHGIHPLRCFPFPEPRELKLCADEMHFTLKEVIATLIRSACAFFGRRDDLNKGRIQSIPGRQAAYSLWTWVDGRMRCSLLLGHGTGIKDGFSQLLRSGKTVTELPLLGQRVPAIGNGGKQAVITTSYNHGGYVKLTEGTTYARWHSLGLKWQEGFCTGTVSNTVVHNWSSQACLQYG